MDIYKGVITKDKVKTSTDSGAKNMPTIVTNAKSANPYRTNFATDLEYFCF